MKKHPLTLLFVLLLTTAVQADSSILKSNSLLFKNGSGWYDDGIYLEVLNGKHLQLDEVKQSADYVSTQNLTFEGSLIINNTTDTGPNLITNDERVILNNVYLGEMDSGWFGFCHQNVKESRGTDYAIVQNSAGDVWVNCKEDGKIYFCLDGTTQMTFDASDGGGRNRIMIGEEATNPSYTLEVKDGIILDSNSPDEYSSATDTTGTMLYFGGAAWNTDPMWIRKRFNGLSNKNILQLCPGDDADGDTVRFHSADADGTMNLTPYIEFTTDSNVNVSSDKRLKTNIKKITNASKIIQRLNPVQFHWKNNQKNPPKYKQMGLIAQETEKIIPLLVKQNQRSGYKNVNYLGLQPFLIEAIKEQSSRIEKQEEELNALLTTVKKLKRKQKIKSFFKKIGLIK